MTYPHYLPYQYREVEYADPAATLDVYICKAPGSSTYAATLARIDPACCFCGGAMQLAEDTPWLYGFYASPLSEEQCCSGCFNTKVQPAREAQRLAEEAKCRAEEARYAEAYRAKKDAAR